MAIRKNNYSMDLTQGNLFVQIFAFSIPLMLSSCLQMLFNAADIIVVSRFAGDVYSAAVSSTSSIVNLTVNLFIGLSIGTNVVIAKAIGARDNDGIYHGVHTAILLSLLSGLVLSVIGIFIAKPMLLMMGSPEDVINYSVTYLSIYFLGMPFNLLYNFGSSILRAKGDTKRPLYFLFVAGVINVILNLLFVIVFKMNVQGVAIATIASQFVSSILVVISLMNEDGITHLDLKKLHLDKNSMLDIMRVGIPAGLQGCLFSITNIVIQKSINSFGSITMAGNGDAGNLEGFLYSAMNAFSQACLTIVGQNYGAKNYKRIYTSAFLVCLISTVVSAVLGIGLYLAGPVLLEIYTNDQAVIAEGMKRLAVVAQFYFTFAVSDAMVCALRGIGYSLTPTLVSLIGISGIRLIWIYTFCVNHNLVEYVYMSYPISWAITSFIQAMMFILSLKKVKKYCQES